MKELKSLFKHKKMTTGEKIKAYRHAYELSQVELAKILDLRQENLSAIENDRKEIGLKTAIKFCAIYNITLDDLIFDSGIENHPIYKEVRQKIKKGSA